MGTWIEDDELTELEQRADPADVPRLVAEIRRLRVVATARADEVLRLSRLLDAQAAATEQGQAAPTSAAGPNPKLA